MEKKVGRPHKSEARTQYLKAAKELFLKNGYKNTSIRMIGKAVGYNQSNFYTYWKSKEDLFIDVIKEVDEITLTKACDHPVEFAMLVEKILSRDGTLIKKLSELSPERLLSML